VPIAAQHIEASFSAGYTASEGITVSDRIILGNLYNRVEPNSGGSYNFTVGGYIGPHWLAEFMYGHQSSKLSAEGPGIKTDISDLNLDTYHGNFVYDFGTFNSPIRPYAFFGLGATSYDFGTFLIPPTGQTGQIPGSTKFSTTWGAGVKIMPHNSPVGIKGAIQWTPTYITSNSAGYWCDPFYGCWLVGNAQYSHQFETSGGVVVRF
jgi:hypothetical protein